MERREPPGCDSDAGFNTLICQEDLEDHPSYYQSNKNSQHVFMFSMNPGRRYRLAALVLVLLAAVLLIVDISLGVRYNKLPDTHLTLADTERISKEVASLQDTYQAAIQATKGAKKQLDGEMSSQKQTNWELEHQTKRTQDYEGQIDKITQDVAKLRSHSSLMEGGCKHCPPGWILMKSVCYYFPFLDSAGVKTWQKAREFCQAQGGDLIVLDTKDKQNSTVSYLLNHHDPSKSQTGFWIGLRDSQVEGTWKWLDNTMLLEGYWNDGQPSNTNNEDCAAVYAVENFFKAWNDGRCGSTMKWICEKAPTSLS